MDKALQMAIFIFMIVHGSEMVPAHETIIRNSIAVPGIPMANIPDKPTITVWVHGTRFIFQHSPPGLLHATSLPDGHYLKDYAQELAHWAPHKFPINMFYTFGWSGQMNCKKRVEAARDLYIALINECLAIQQCTGMVPAIRLITHSHGGNVALNLARFQDLYRGLVIDELIMLACPAQQATQKYIANPMFKAIFHICSLADPAQLMDPEGLYHKGAPFFSQRWFNPYPNLIQASLTINDRSPSHTSFFKPYMARILPWTLEALKSQSPSMTTCHLALDIVVAHFR